ncbi:MAG TPA: hypothetical protein EYH01_07085 [Campylobacterales bacterium]|nr:hypothetical protein [Campylobacterales bacterium]
MKYIVIIIFFFNLSTAFAKGVRAGTVIQNSAMLSFSLEEEEFIIKSNVAKSVVDQLIDVKVSWMDTRPMVVSLGERQRVLTYKVLNSGNGRDRYTLLAQELNYKSEFSLEEKRVYLDANDNYRLDASDPQRKTVTLDEDREQLVFVVSKIGDALTASSGSQNFVNLKALSRIGGSGEKGKIYIGRGIDGVDVVDGFSGGVSEDEGSYKLLIANVILNKDVSIDNDGIITVSVLVTVGGEGSVKDVNIVDEIPNETIYVKNSLLLDGGALTDQDDSDQGRYKRKYKERKAQILMSLGELDISSTHTITYSLKIR